MDSASSQLRQQYHRVWPGFYFSSSPFDGALIQSQNPSIAHHEAEPHGDEQAKKPSEICAHFANVQ
jgi:hypothetical protein